MFVVVKSNGTYSSKMLRWYLDSCKDKLITTRSTDSVTKHGMLQGYNITELDLSFFTFLTSVMVEDTWSMNGMERDRYIADSLLHLVEVCVELKDEMRNPVDSGDLERIKFEVLKHEGALSIFSAIFDCHLKRHKSKTDDENALRRYVSKAVRVKMTGVRGVYKSVSNKGYEIKKYRNRLYLINLLSELTTDKSVDIEFVLVSIPSDVFSSRLRSELARLGNEIVSISEKPIDMGTQVLRKEAIECFLLVYETKKRYIRALALKPTKSEMVDFLLEIVSPLLESVYTERSLLTLSDVHISDNATLPPIGLGSMSIIARNLYGITLVRLLKPRISKYEFINNFRDAMDIGR